REREEQAKRICRDCPVLAVCREHALKTPEKYGVWGAMTTQERLRVSTPAS
ncbi:MAG TPA: WhiB family transcriptional regulator, partial [Mycobacterium sp.]